MGQDVSDPSPTGGVTQTKDWRHTGQQLGFYGAAVSVQPTAVVDPAGGATVDAQARQQLSLLLARLRTLGIIST